MPHHDGVTGDQVSLVLRRCPNSQCGKVEVVVSRAAGKITNMAGMSIIFETPTNNWRLAPESASKPWPPCVPAVMVKDYHEACLIVDKSPKASATLSRRVLQGMISDFWGIKQKGKTRTLAKQIDALKGKVESAVWDAIDALRKLGNIGAHMEKDINLIVDVEPHEAAALIGLIEMLFEEWYVARDKRANSLKAITAIAAGKKPASAAAPVPVPPVPVAPVLASATPVASSSPAAGALTTATAPAPQSGVPAP